jgi:hypothetical protein
VAERVLTAIFQQPGDFIAQENHLARGAFFLPAPEPPPEPLELIVLRVEAPTGDVAEVLVRVVQISATNVALALEDPPGARAALDPLLAAARGAGPGEGGTWVFWGSSPPDGEPAAPASDEESDPPGTGEAREGLLYEQIRAMSAQEKMQLALHGDRAARLLLLKDQNKTIHAFLLQNPRITLDEIRYLAGYRQANPDALVTIAAHRDWGQNANVVLALARNPKTPTPTAVKLLDKIAPVELRRLAKSAEVPRAVQAAARKKVTEP